MRHAPYGDFRPDERFGWRDAAVAGGATLVAAALMLAIVCALGASLTALVAVIGP